MADNTPQTQDQAKSSFLTKLVKLFGVSVASDKKGQVSGKRRGSFVPKTNDLPSEVARLFRWYINEVLESEPPARQERYDELDFMIKNSSDAAFIENTYIDECLQVSRYEKPLLVDTKDSALKLYIEKKFDEWNIYSNLRPMLESLVRYGDSPILPVIELNKLNKSGIAVKGMTVLPVRKFAREEPTPQVTQSTLDKVIGDKNKDPITQMVYASNIVAELYSARLTGYRIFMPDRYGGSDNQGFTIPPWLLIHIKQPTTDPDWGNYGKSYLEPLRSVYKQLLANETLMSIARASRFDRIIFKVKVTGQSPHEQFEQLNEFMTAFRLNSSALSNKSEKERAGISEDIWMPVTDDRDVAIERLGSSINVDDIGDIEYWRNKFYTASRLPKSYLLADQTDVNEDSLVSQDLKFARLIYRIQHDLLVGLTLAIKLSILLDGKQDVFAAHKFSLAMPLPVSKVTKEEMDLIKSRFEAVKSIIETINSMLGDDAQAPVEVVKSLLGRYQEIPQDEIESLVNKIVSYKKANPTASTDDLAGAGAENPLDFALGDDDKEKERKLKLVDGIFRKSPKSEALTEYIFKEYHYLQCDHPDASLMEEAKDGATKLVESLMAQATKKDA